MSNLICAELALLNCWFVPSAASSVILHLC